MRCASILALLLSGPAFAGTVAASSERKDDAGVRHTAALAFDGELATSWMEGQDGPGEGAWLEISLDRVTPIVSLSVWPGDLSMGRRSLREFGRPRTLTVELTGGASEVSQQVVFEDGAVVGPKRVDIPIRGDARKIRLRMDEVYEGLVHAGDTAIAEVAINFVEGEPHPWVGKIFAWVESGPGQREKADNDTEVAALVEKVRAGGDEGDAAALADLVGRAGDAAPYLRRQVARYVPLGFRVAALPPDDASVKALLELKDPNTIPAIERASLRVKGHDEKRLQQDVEKFYAYAELIGGRSANVPNWGQSGWAPGELLGLGEPLDIEADSTGRLYVADTGNHRVQRFSATGNAEASWGSGTADITNTWIGGPRRWYVAGNAPGTAKGSFQAPLDVCVIPGKTADTVAVLDASGHVQVFDAAGRVMAEWVARVPNTPLIAGVGGQGYLLHAKGRLVALWGNRAMVWDMTGTELASWEITDGTPSGAESLPNGKLLLIFGDDLVMYSADGFRHGSVLGDTLGSGFEAWDIAVDEGGKLWAVTDTGTAIKYKKPGKPEFTLKISKDPIALPRIDVFDGVIFLTTRDGIRRIDALELWAKEQAGG